MAAGPFVLRRRTLKTRGLALGHVVGSLAFTTGGALPPENTDFIRTTDDPIDGATWFWSNWTFATPWNNPGGDWRDRLGAAQGTQVWASLTVNTFTSNQLRTVDVTNLFNEWRANGNTGLHIRRISGPTCNIAGRLHAAKPVLRVTNSAGTVFICPLKSTIWLDVTQSTPIQHSVNQNTVTAPCLMRWRIDMVTGTVVSAFIDFTIVTVFGGTLPSVFELNRIDATRIIENPAVQINNPRTDGLAKTVPTNDYDLGNATLFPEIIQYDSPANDSQITTRFVLGSQGPNSVDAISEGPHSFFDMPEYNIKAIRTAFGLSNQRAVQWLKFMQPVDALPASLQGAPWRKPYTRGQELGYTELWCRFLIRVGSDVKSGMNELGIKLPGLEGTYEFEGSGSVCLPRPSSDTTWSYWFWHGPPSIEHPGLFHAALYSYDQDNDYLTHPSNGAVRYMNQYPGVFLREEQFYCVDIRVKQNTITGGVPDANGICEVYIDENLVHYAANLRVRKAPEANIHAYRQLYYHGGLRYPIGPMHYDSAGITVSKKFVGLPKLQTSPLPAFVPPKGKYGDFSLNLPNDVKPGYYSDAEVFRNFFMWSAGVYVHDYGTGGGIANTGGQEHGNAYDTTGESVLDLETRLYVYRNAPLRRFRQGGNTEGLDPTDEYGYHIVAGGINVPQGTHNYNSICEKPTAWGGGVDGSLIHAGSHGTGTVLATPPYYSLPSLTLYDLSLATEGYSRIYPPNTSTYLDYNNPALRVNGSVQGALEIDRKRIGYWSKMGGVNSNFAFITPAGAVTYDPGGQTNQNRMCLRHVTINGQDLLFIFHIWQDTGWFNCINLARNVAAYSPIGSMNATTFTRSFLGISGGAQPCLGPDNVSYIADAGPNWDDELGVFYGLDHFRATPTMFYLRPANINDLLNTSWTAEYEVITPNGTTLIQPTVDGVDRTGGAKGALGSVHWISRFKSFVYCGSNSKKAQLIRPAVLGQ
jgi:hypothetical protein